VLQRKSNSVHALQVRFRNVVMGAIQVTLEQAKERLNGVAVAHACECLAVLRVFAFRVVSPCGGAVEHSPLAQQCYRGCEAWPTVDGLCEPLPHVTAVAYSRAQRRLPF
jgi:hypothetical protein